MVSKEYDEKYKEPTSSGWKESAGELVSDRGSVSAGLQCLAKPNDIWAMTQEKHPESSIALCQTKLSKFEARQKLRDEELKEFVGGLLDSREEDVLRTERVRRRASRNIAFIIFATERTFRHERRSFTTCPGVMRILMAEAQFHWWGSG